MVYSTFIMLCDHPVKSFLYSVCFMLLHSCLKSADINGQICRNLKKFHHFWGYLSLVKCLFFSNVLHILGERECHMRFLFRRYMLIFFSFDSVLHCLYFTISVNHIPCFIKKQCNKVFLGISWTFSWNCPRKVGILRW